MLLANRELLIPNARGVSQIEEVIYLGPSTVPAPSIDQARQLLNFFRYEISHGRIPSQILWSEDTYEILSVAASFHQNIDQSLITTVEEMTTRLLPAHDVRFEKIDEFNEENGNFDDNNRAPAMNNVEPDEQVYELWDEMAEVVDNGDDEVVGNGNDNIVADLDENVPNRFAGGLDPHDLNLNEQNLVNLLMGQQGNNPEFAMLQDIPMLPGLPLLVHPDRGDRLRNGNAQNRVEDRPNNVQNNFALVNQLFVFAPAALQQGIWAAIRYAGPMMIRGAGLLGLGLALVWGAGAALVAETKKVVGTVMSSRTGKKTVVLRTSDSHI